MTYKIPIINLSAYLESVLAFHVDKRLEKYTIPLLFISKCVGDLIELAPCC